MSQAEKIEFRKCIVAVSGPNLSGKSTFSNALKEKTNLKYFDVDEAKWCIIPRQERFPDGIERLAMMSAYAFNHFRAGKELAEKLNPVIVTATYSHPTYHSLLREFAKAVEVPLVVFVCKISEEKYSERILARQKDTENISVITNADIAKRLRKNFQPYPEGFEIRTDRPLDEVIDSSLYYLNDLRVKQNH